MSTVSLTIDYSNGSQKSLATIPWSKHLTILEALQAAEKIPPGLVVEFGSSRNGSVISLSLDGVPNEGLAGEWSIWVNQRPGPERLGTTTSFGFNPDSRPENELKAGDHILAKLVAPPIQDA
jgi:hypothetical protein